ncbi:LIM domain-binding protein 3-like isoform X2 [Penaeus chinensis]|uniref:LIM domain-binding protein 3-like isoform X2 n=1 Tax=Penaeus chinensis TaxID=139456 RepID=UPI001FB69F5E|nr:LIM domain-binding protein 3-like isoform X2 [Penaeus chinensis]
MTGVIRVTLERDGHDQPWGFRLQGGVDVAMPLSVQRVLVGTPADGVLIKGDVITKISCTDTKGITHQQAADLFNNAGNQIDVYLKRPGAPAPPATAAAAAPQTPLVNGGPDQSPTAASSKSENPAVRSLPKTQFALKSQLSQLPQRSPTVNMEALSIQSQPYRTLPLVQPSAKARSDMGIGSISHLKMQDDHISGDKQPQLAPHSQALAAKAKHDELVMKQKVTGSLQQITQTQQSLTTATQQHQAPVSKQYNSPQALYSPENVQEVLRQQTSPTHVPTLKPSPTPAQKPIQVVLTPSKEYNPQSSATWRALQETDAPMDPEKVANYTSLKEHDPIYSEVYAAPVAPKPGQRPVPRTNALPGPRSPVSDLLPASMRPAAANDAAELDGAAPARSFLSPPKTGPSVVRSAALAEAKPVNHQMTSEPVKIPLFETNAIGGRKRIAQTASFNKLMMEVLGE